MAIEGEKLGTYYFDVRADASGIPTDLEAIGKEIEKELDEISSQSELAGARMTGAFNKSGNAIEENTQKIVAFQSKMTAAIGVVTGITGAVGLAAAGFIKFGQSMLEAAKEAGRVRDRVEELSDAIRRFDPDDAINKMGRFADEYDRLLELILSSDLPMEEVTKLWKDLDESLASAKQNAREIRFDDAQRSALQAADALKDIKEQIDLNLSATPELDAAWRDYRSTIKDVNEQVKILSESEKELFGSGRVSEASELLGLRRKLYKEALQAANDELDIRLQKAAEEEQLRAREQAERIRAERDAALQLEAEKDRRSQERVQREIDTLREGLESLTGSEFITTLEAIPKALREVSNGVRRIK